MTHYIVLILIFISNFAYSDLFKNIQNWKSLTDDEKVNYFVEDIKKFSEDYLNMSVTHKRITNAEKTKALDSIEVRINKLLSRYNKNDSDYYVQSSKADAAIRRIIYRTLTMLSSAVKEELRSFRALQGDIPRSAKIFSIFLDKEIRPFFFCTDDGEFSSEDYLKAFLEEGVLLVPISKDFGGTFRPHAGFFDSVYAFFMHDAEHVARMEYELATSKNYQNFCKKLQEYYKYATKFADKNPKLKSYIIHLLFLYLHELPEAFSCNYPTTFRTRWLTLWNTVKNDKDILNKLKKQFSNKYCNNPRQIIINENIDESSLIKELIIMSFNLHDSNKLSTNYLKDIIDHDLISPDDDSYNILVAMAYFFQIDIEGTAMNEHAKLLNYHVMKKYNRQDFNKYPKSQYDSVEKLKEAQDKTWKIEYAILQKALDQHFLIKIIDLFQLLDIKEAKKLLQQLDLKLNNLEKIRYRIIFQKIVDSLNISDPQERDSLLKNLQRIEKKALGIKNRRAKKIKPNIESDYSDDESDYYYNESYYSDEESDYYAGSDSNF